MLLFASLLSSVLVFLAGAIEAHAALPSGGKYLTAQEMRSIIGDSVTGRYYNGSEYVDVTYYYNAVQSVADLQQYESSDIVTTGKQYLVYAATVGAVNQNPDYITFDIHPEFSLLDTQFIYMFCGHSIRTGVSSSVYSPPRWEWVINGQSTVYQNQALNPGQDQWAHARATQSFWWTYAECAYQSNISVSGYSLRASFFGNNVNGSTAYFVIGLPYISDAGSGVSGTGAPIVTGTDINVNVDVDLTETNSILDSILNGISGLVNGIKGLFVPDQADVIAFKEDLADILDDTFSGYSEAEEYIEDVRQILVDPAPSSIIKFPAIDVPCTNLHIDAQQVDVNYNNEHMEFVRVFVDIIFTIWLINMIMNKHHAIMVGEKSVEVEGVDVDDY